MLQYHIRNETRLTVVEGFCDYFFSTNPQLTMDLSTVVFALSLDAQQQKHGFTEEPENG